MRSLPAANLRLIGILLSATMLQGCESVGALNVLAAIDGPYVSPAEREARAREAEGLAPLAEEVAAAPVELAEPELVAIAPAPEPIAGPAAQPVAERVTPPSTALVPEPQPDAAAAALPVTSANLIGPVLPAEEMAQLVRTDTGPSAELIIQPATDNSAALAEAEAIAKVLGRPANASADLADLLPPAPEAQPIGADEALQIAELAESSETDDSAAALAVIPAEAEPVSEQEALALVPVFTEPDPAGPEPAEIVPALDLTQEMSDEPEEPALALSIEEPAPPAVSLIGPDFLPPEVVEAEPAQLAALPAPVPVPAATVAGTSVLVGPTLAETTPAAPAARPPSAFDFVIEDEPAVVRPDRAGVLLADAPGELAPVASPDPSPPPAPAALRAAPVQAPSNLERQADALGLSVVTSMPAPGGDAFTLPAGTGSEAYVPFYEHVMAQLDNQQTAGARESMLLLDPPSLDPALQICGNRPPAVLIDLDPANGLLPLVGRGNNNPMLATLLQTLRQRGVTIYWISGHGPGAASAIRQRLVASTLDPSGTDPLIVTRFAGESKQERRYGLGETNCLLAIMGDQRADFDELYDFVLDPVMAAPLEGLVGDGWFLAPPPLD